MPPFQPLVAIVDFHHLRGPEVEQWFGLEENVSQPPQYDSEWSLLPFLALPDGAHASAEEISYFTLRNSSQGDTDSPTSLFGISCTRSLSAALLAQRNPDVTRSAVQKAIVAILPSPGLFARIREKLSAVTKAWFAQANFEDSEIIGLFWEDLVLSCAAPQTPPTNPRWDDTKALGERRDDSMDDYVGLSLRHIVHTWRHNFLVMFKALLLQKRILFFGSHCEELCLLQFSLVSLVPGLIKQLNDCADPSFTAQADEVKRRQPPSSLQTSSRASLLTYMGLPLQLFGAGAMFGPYTPLQQLSLLEDSAGGTKSFLAGSTNALLVRRPPGALYDVLVNLDESSVELSDELRQVLTLTPADRAFMDLIVASVTETWDEKNPGRPTTLGYGGSEEWIRLQFEEYLLAFLSCVAAHEAEKAEPGSTLMPPAHVSRSPSPSAPAPLSKPAAASSPAATPEPLSEKSSLSDQPAEVTSEPSTQTTSQAQAQTQTPTQAQAQQPQDPPPNPTPWTDFSLAYLLAFLATPAAHIFTHQTAPLPLPLPALTPARHPCANAHSSPLSAQLASLQSDLSARLAGLNLDARLARAGTGFRAAGDSFRKGLGEGRARAGGFVAGVLGELEARRVARELERANAEIERDAMVGMQRAKQREVAAALGRPATPSAEQGLKRMSRDAGSVGGSPRGASSAVSPMTTTTAAATKRESRGAGEDASGAGEVSARPSLETAGQRASAYFAGWGQWAQEKRRAASAAAAAKDEDANATGESKRDGLAAAEGKADDEDKQKDGTS